MANAEDKQIMSVQERIASRLAKVDKTTSAPVGKNISTAGGIFTLPDKKTSPGPLNCIVVDYVNSNSYYDTPYNPNDIQPPACHAIGRELETMVPAESVENPVNATCKGCPNNEFGSAGRGKACTNNVILAILPEGFDDDSEIFTIKVSPTAITGWSGYVRQLAEQGVDPIQVVTSIKFKEGVSYPSLVFKQLGGNDALDNVGAFLPQADALLSAPSGA